MLSIEFYILLILAVIELLLNIEVVISTYSYRMLQKPINLAILNILLTLILQALFAVPSYSLIRTNMVDINIIKVLHEFSTSITMYSLTLGNLILVLDRLLFTWYLEQYPNIVTKPKMILVITAKWMYVIAISAPYLPFKHEPSTKWQIILVIVNGLCIITIIMATQLFILIQCFRHSSNDNTLESRKAYSKQIKSHKASFAATFFHNMILIMSFGPLFVYKFFELIQVVRNFKNKNENGEDKNNDVIPFMINLLSYIHGLCVPWIYRLIYMQQSSQNT